MDYINCNVATNVVDDSKPKALVETKEALVLDAPTKDEPTWKRNLAKICAFDVARLDEVVGGGGAHGCAYNRLVNEDFHFLGDKFKALAPDDANYVGDVEDVDGVVWVMMDVSITRVHLKEQSFEAEVGLCFGTKRRAARDPDRPKGWTEHDPTETEAMLRADMGLVLDWSSHARLTSLEPVSLRRIARRHRGAGQPLWEDVQVACRFYVTIASQEFDLHFFPFDFQEFRVPVEIRFTGDDKRHVVRAGAGIRSRSLLGEWDFFDPALAIHARRKNCRVLFGVCVGMRRSRHYLVNYYLQIFVLTCLFVTYVAIDRSNVGERLGFTVTLVLAAAALQLTLREGLPTCPYSTKLDIYLYASFFTLCASSLTIALVTVAPKGHRRILDLSLAAALLLAWLAFTAYHLAHARRLVRSARAQLGDPLAPTPCADSTRSGTRSFFQANLADHLPDHRLNRINALSSKAPPGDAPDW